MALHKTRVGVLCKKHERELRRCIESMFRSWCGENTVKGMSPVVDEDYIDRGGACWES